MVDTIVVREPVEVLRVRADLKGAGPPEAFRQLESKLSSLKGRRFYGTVAVAGDAEEYHACVERRPTDDPVQLGLEPGVIPGGRYARQKILGWERVIAEGKLRGIFRDLVRRHPVDRSRPDIEFYRSRSELHLLVPVTGQAPAPYRVR